MSKLKDLTGQRFGRLLVVSREPNNKHGMAVWKTDCDCGNHTITRSQNLVEGKTKSCGCRRSEVGSARVYKHGKTKTRLFRAWCGMRARVNNSRGSKYKYNGGRGVKICNEWRDDFTAFQDWAMANGYRDDLVLDRIDSFEDYKPSNCRWITRTESARKPKAHVRKLIRKLAEEKKSESN